MHLKFLTFVPWWSLVTPDDAGGPWKEALQMRRRRFRPMIGHQSVGAPGIWDLSRDQHSGKQKNGRLKIGIVLFYYMILSFIF